MESPFQSCGGNEKEVVGRDKITLCISHSVNESYGPLDRRVS